MFHDIMADVDGAAVAPQRTAVQHTVEDASMLAGQAGGQLTRAGAFAWQNTEGCNERSRSDMQAGRSACGGRGCAGYAVSEQTQCHWALLPPLTGAGHVIETETAELLHGGVVWLPSSVIVWCV